ncbi:MAG: transcription termination/antitermination protein NusG [Candidatus Omnitrophica bacterium]|nr:transcription termination/antitermination protein NusG [Candidatus Omnitrophota bacterium]
MLTRSFVLKRWYVVHTQTGSEEKVKMLIENKIHTEGLQDLISRIVIPTEQVAEVRLGKKRISNRKFFPGYILVEMELNEKTYLFIKRTPGVTGFIGPRKKLLALDDTEVENIIKRAEEAKTKPAPKVAFERGEQVRVKEGPFVNFTGTVEEIYPEKGKLKVNVMIFGRATPLELEFWQVEKF